MREKTTKPMERKTASFEEQEMPFDDMMFMRPEMMPRGPGGRGCGRGMGMGRGGFGMGRGGAGRPDPRWMMSFGGPQYGADPRQMAYGWMHPGFGGMGGPPCASPPAMWGPPHMPWAAYPPMGGHAHMPWFGPFGRGGCGGHRRGRWFKKFMEEMQQPEDQDMGVDSQNEAADGKSTEGKRQDEKPGETHEVPEEGAQASKCDRCGGRGQWRRGHPGRHGLLKRLQRMFEPMEDPEDTTSSDLDSGDDAPTGKDKEARDRGHRHGGGGKQCRRAWRQAMRHQHCGGPGGSFYGGGPPMMGWGPAWDWSAGGGPPCRPGMPPHLLHRLRRLLTAMEAETTRQGNPGNEKTPNSEGQTAEGQTQNTGPSGRPARLQARLRRLINHVERQNENQDFLPAQPWMWGPPGCWQGPRHGRRMRRRMRGAEKCENGKHDEELSEDDTAEKDACGDDVTMAAANPEHLDDWENLCKDMEHLQTSQSPQNAKLSPPTCPHCHSSLQPKE